MIKLPYENIPTAASPATVAIHPVLEYVKKRAATPTRITMCGWILVFGALGEANAKETNNSIADRYPLRSFAVG
jgi:hypothetical protein